MQKDETREENIELEVERMPIDIIIAEPIFVHETLKKSIGYIMQDLGLEYNLHLREDVIDPDYYLEEAPENAIVYAHSSFSNQHSFFSMVLDVSPQRQDLRFIVRMRDTYGAINEFQDWESLEAYRKLSRESPHPSRPISISTEEAAIFTSWVEEGEESFKHYMSELKQIRGVANE